MLRSIPLAFVRRLPGTVLLWLVAASMAAAAPPTVKYLYPSGGQRGQSVDVTLNGTFGTWPVTTHVLGDGVHVEATSDKGKVRITIPTDGLPGVHLLRVHDAEGASSLRPFIVGILPEVMEQEPNDQPTAPQSVDARVVVNGKLAKADDVDGYRIELSQGQTVVVSLCANRILKSPMDGVLQLCDEAGFVIEQNDDELGIDPQIVFTAPKDGAYLVRTFAFPETPNSTIAFSGADNYVYRLTITTGPYVDHAMPMVVHQDQPTQLQLFGWNLAESQGSLDVAPPAGEPHVNVFQNEVANFLTLPATRDKIVVAQQPGTAKAPQHVSLPSVICGQIENRGDTHVYQFAASKGDSLLFRVDARRLGYRIDPWLGIQDGSGKLLTEVDDSKGKVPDPELTWKVPADGDYQLHLRDLHGHGGPRYVYRLTAAKPPSDYQLTLPVDSGVTTKDKPLEVTVNVSRRGGFNAEIDIAVAELPTGITCEVVKSAAKGDSAKSVKLKIATDGSQAFSGPLRIVGTANDEAKTERTARFTVPATVRSIGEFWVTSVQAK